jgi:hypothetical protein
LNVHVFGTDLLDDDDEAISPNDLARALGLLNG